MMSVVNTASTPSEPVCYFPGEYMAFFQLFLFYIEGIFRLHVLNP